MWNKLLVVGLAAFAVVLLAGLSVSQKTPEETREEQNKAIILRVYGEIFGQGKTEVVDELFSKKYIQHNPMVPNGPEGLKGYVKILKSSNPPPVITVKHILADGDFVAIHWHASTTPGNESTGQVGFDLFRLDNGTVVEHWDVIQNVSAKTASGNSMFSDLYKYKGGTPNITEEQEEANKQLALKAYDGVFNGRQLGLLDQYFAGANYIQHNPQIPNGTTSLKNLDAFWPKGSLVQFHHVVADGDLVFIHSQALPPGADPHNEFTGQAWADLFRVVNGKIVEHWDVIQQVPAKTTSGNSMFSDLYKANASDKIL